MSTGKTYSTKYLLDSNNNRGSEGQILSTTSTGIDWVDANSVPGTGLWVTSGNSIYNSNSGNIGIGTASPAKQLVVRSSAPWIRIEEDSASNKRLDLWVDPTSAIGYIGANQSAQQLSFQTGSSDRIRILNNGNVGIGTTAPGAKLVISGGGGAISDNGFQINSSYGFNGTGVLEINPSATSHIPLSILSKNGQTANLVNVTSFGGTAGNLFNVQSSGNVGIGTTNPGAKLDVAGDIRTSSNFIADNATLGSLSLRISGTETGRLDNFNSALRLINFHASSETIVQGNGNISLNSVGSSNIKLSTANTERMRIDSDGNVGIGTTAPGEKLVIAGGVLAYGDTSSIGSGTSYYLGNNPNSRDIVFTRVANAELGIGRYNGGWYETMRFDADGNVGIGTTSPSRLLDVDGIQGWSEGTNVEKAYLNPTGTGTDFNLLGDNGDIRFDSRAGSNSYINTGNVGIGTTSPDSLLEISTTDGTKNFVKLTSGAGGVNPTLVFEKSAAEQGVIQYIRNGDLKIYNTDSDGGVMLSGSSATNYDMYINNSGNVGIGTTSPGSRKLSVVKDTGITAGFNDITEFLDTTLGGGGSVSLNVGRENSSKNLGKMAFKYVSSGSNSNALNFGFYDADNLMTIQASGNVGIGTDSPANRLVVETSTAGDYAALINNTHSTTGYGLLARTASTGTSAYALAARAGASDIFVVRADGNVGIGTTSPQSLLHLTHANPILLLEEIDQIADAKRWGIQSETSILKFRAFNDALTTAVDVVSMTRTGNVGIGATSPASKLNVASTGANAYSPTLDSASNMKGIRNVLTSNADDMVGIYFATGSSTTGTHWSGITGSRSDNASHWGTQLNFYTHNNDVANLNHATQKMVIKGNGNIGIGNDDPGAKLDVKGNYGDVIKAVSGSQNITTNFVAPSTGSGLNSIISTGGKLNIGTSDAQIFNLTTNSLSRISILSDGKVGIGTTSPSQKLEVAGSVAVTGTNVTVANASNPYIYINDTNAGAGIFQQEGNTTRIGSDSNTQVVLVQNNATAVTIDTSKNVGIGTTSPDYKLEVNGTLGVNRTDGIIFAGSAAAGYGNKITADTSNDFIFSTSLPSAPYTVSEKMRIANGGATTFTSTVTATNFILSSDERLKENIEKVCDNRVKADWKTFELKTEKGQKRYGVIAQELEKTNPEFVREDSQGFKSVAYIDLLIAKIAELEARLEKLEK